MDSLIPGGIGEERARGIILQFDFLRVLEEQQGPGLRAQQIRSLSGGFA
jgi:hypothetical protein